MNVDLDEILLEHKKKLSEDDFTMAKLRKKDIADPLSSDVECSCCKDGCIMTLGEYINWDGNCKYKYTEK